MLCTNPNAHFHRLSRPEVSYLAASGAANGSGAAGEAGDEEAAEEDEPKAELQLGDDSTLLFKEPAKLYFKDKDGVVGPPQTRSWLCVSHEPFERQCSAAVQCDVSTDR